MNRCSLYRLFETNRESETLEYLEKYLDHAKIGMTKEKYLTTCALLGDEIDEKKMPPDLDDFPSYVHQALDVFNCLPDTYSGGMEPIYSGKDYSALSDLFSVLNVEKEDQLLVFKVVHSLDTRARTQAINEAKRKAKKGGKK